MAIPDELMSKIKACGMEIASEEVLEDGTTVVTVSDSEAAVARARAGPDVGALAAIAALSARMPGIGGGFRRRGKGPSGHRNFPIPK